MAGCGLAWVAGLLVMAFTQNPVSLHLGAGFLIGLALFTAASVLAATATSGPILVLARVLQGGTWSAGRVIAKQKRAGGVPPLTLKSDGMVF